MTKKKELILEYVIPCSAAVLYKFLKSESGLGEWFADRVTATSDGYDFFWGKFPTRAHLTAHKDNSYVRFVWDEDLGTDYYFEMRILVTELSKETSLHIVDFAHEDEIEDLVNIYNSGVKKLKRRLGVK